jgi:hypothetical protein
MLAPGKCWAVQQWLPKGEHTVVVLHRSLQESIPQVGGIALQLQRFPHGMRTVGYDVPAVDWMHYESTDAAATVASLVQPAEQAAESAAAAGNTGSGGCSCGAAGAHKHATNQQQPSAAAAAVAAANLGLSAERLQSLQQQLQDIAQQRRVVGYNVPALDQQQIFLEQFTAQQNQQQPGTSSVATAAAAAAVGAVSADSSSRMQQDRQLYDRKYFKSPCNNPEAWQLFKNSNNHPMDRPYYKNPANAPVLVQDVPQQPLQVCFYARFTTPQHLRHTSPAPRYSVMLTPCICQKVHCMVQVLVSPKVDACDFGWAAAHLLLAGSTLAIATECMSLQANDPPCMLQLKTIPSHAVTAGVNRAADRRHWPRRCCRICARIALPTGSGDGRIDHRCRSSSRHVVRCIWWLRQQRPPPQVRGTAQGSAGGS